MSKRNMIEKRKQLSTEVRKDMFKKLVIGTLIAITRKYNISIKEYKTCNHLRSFNVIVNHKNIAIHVGSELVKFEGWDNKYQDLYIFNFNVNLFRKYGYELDDPTLASKKVITRFIKIVNAAKKTKRKIKDIDQFELVKWFERDRSYVALRDIETEEMLIELWDEDVEQLAEDGFIEITDTRDGPDPLLKQSLYNYARILNGDDSRAIGNKTLTGVLYALSKKLK
jgi:hypothetical protein